MNVKKLVAGGFIEARCTRCRAVLNHTIVAMVGEKVVRVECNTCRGIHNYHAEKVSKQRSTSGASAVAARKPKADQVTLNREEWQAARAGMEIDKAITYSMTGKFKVNSLISHSVFGFGVVKSISANKVEVLFEDGVKLLRCG